ncbi:hypothetical protein QBC34DRAFT_398105 [Podospora aff. communis PSN243]|uniref:CHCH domain-containing protein n=1 Tax=Podospora aff. communis PSN243 TaxID=3040156 RepID=A0AAV9GZS9_9PEZI|nr:hypothetical protein QBC34DRAFT_398105 [Podospora aff. communis PSN243]
MAPPCETFPVQKLPSEVQLGTNGKLRKTVDGRRIDLQKDCELLELMQYECLVLHPEIPNSPVQCWPVQRLFRRCQDKNGKFTVETTAWEGVTAPDTMLLGQDSGRKIPIAGAKTKTMSS